ncbi:hypothetical protein LROSL3_1097 [Furfurilactobacillus rossiae]|jgi:hypothetical protein|nr:hypothetical protein LROSL2_1096 [Furfurilactobacillus rossiae]QLE68876.1 hypothetical protein LROSL3_1097 [Furfurilactobacillus rossiae]
MTKRARLTEQTAIMYGRKTIIAVLNIYLGIVSL